MTNTETTGTETSTATPTRTPLYGHTSQETAYLVNDYPYGFTLRCKIRYWLEKNPKKGFRFWSQTTNPKKAGDVWNKPKASTYVDAAACMYLDEKGHVHWSGIGAYTNPAAVLRFLQDFPEADLSLLRGYVTMAYVVSKKIADGSARFTINGVVQPVSEAEQERNNADRDEWAKVRDLLLAMLPEKAA